MGRFLKGEIDFLDIADIVCEALEKQNMTDSYTVDDVFEADAAAREVVLKFKE